MRRVLMSAALLAAAVILQLTIVNGLRLPGGGVPDLVLVVVAAVGLASGPVPGAAAGFAAGLCLDLAPPATGVIGVYALVFVIIGWACGRLRPTLAQSAVLPIVIVAAAAAAGEVMVAGLGLALQSAQVSWASIRLLLPASVSYDIALSPFVLYLVLLAGAWLADADAARPASGGAARAARAASLSGQGAGRAAGLGPGAAPSGRRGLAGPGTLGGGAAPGGVVLLGLGGWLAGPPHSRRARRAAARHTPRLRPGAGHQGDGWIGGSAAARGLAGPAQSGAVRSATGRSITGRSATGRLTTGRLTRGRWGRSALGGSAFRGQILGGTFLTGVPPTGEPLRGQAFRGRVVSGLPGHAPRFGAASQRASAARLRAGVAGSAASGPAPRALPARPARLRLRRRRAAWGGMARTRAVTFGATGLSSSALRGATSGSIRSLSGLGGAGLGSAGLGSAGLGSAGLGSAGRGGAGLGSMGLSGTGPGRSRRGGAGRGLGRRGTAGGRLLVLVTAGRLPRGARLGGPGPVRPGRSLSKGAAARLGRRRPRRAGGFRPAGLPGGTALSRPAPGGPRSGPAPSIRIGRPPP